MRNVVAGLVTEERGAGTGDTVVVLVHGTLDRAASFARVVRRLDDLHTVTYDRRGYGRSVDARPLCTTIAAHADDLLAVIAGRRAVVVGHSYGGTVALAAACRTGAAATPLTPEGPIVAVAAYEPPLPWLGAPDAPPTSVPRAVRDPGPPAVEDADGSTGVRPTPDADGGDPAAAAERFFRRVVGDAAWDRLPEPTRAARRAEGPALVAELAALRSPRPPFDVTSLAVPAVFARGGLSLPRQRGPAGWLATHLPEAELFEIPDAGHGAHLTHPDAFARLVRRTIDRSGRG